MLRHFVNAPKKRFSCAVATPVPINEQVVDKPAFSSSERRRHRAIVGKTRKVNIPGNSHKTLAGMLKFHLLVKQYGKILRASRHSVEVGISAIEPFPFRPVAGRERSDFRHVHSCLNWY